MNLYFKRFLFPGLICLLAALQVAGQQQPVKTATLLGDSVKAGKTLLVRDSIHYDYSSSIASTKKVDNILALYINEFAGYKLPDSFRVKVWLNLTYSNAGGSGAMTDSLTIFYNKNKPYSSKDINYYHDYYSLEAEIDSVDIIWATDTASVRRVLVFENMLSVNRNFITSCTVVGSVAGDTTGMARKGEYRVTWAAQQFIPAYDLEWTFIDSAALDNYIVGGSPDPTLIFKNNSTRVIIAGNEYRIPMLYDGHGKLFFRVRTVQYSPAGEAIFGNWSTGTSNLGIFEFMGHERKLNWQATTSFAEEGKRKSVVQYFDGSLKGRQTVTKDNFTGISIVAETLYDKQGRPAIQVLPAPSLDSLISFKPLFNVNRINSGEYDKSFYDTLVHENEYCCSPAVGMDNTSGASRYYSTSNPESSLSFNQFIPDANKLPFAETRYTRDNTGRIDRQGGVGDSMQIGSGHETRYFYGSATQQELDALFGTEAGEASHYEKNMVQDANGQFSVSYVDMHGRTVATALAGNEPSKLDRLASYNAVLQTDQLLSPTNNIIKDNTIQSNSSILVSKPDSFRFNYKIVPESLSLKDCKDSTICYDCLYDLTIILTNACDSVAKVITRQNFNLFKIDGVTHNLDTTCAAVADSIVVDTTIYLKEGNYDITKVLSLSRDAMQYYRDSIFLTYNTCNTFAKLLTEQLDSIRSKLNCTPDTLVTNLVTAWREQMMADLRPLTGQYGDTALPVRCYSIFELEGGNYRYQNVRGYVDEEGNPDKVSHFNGTVFEQKEPWELSPEEFIANYKDSWGLALLEKHPEYDLLLQYENFTRAYNWEADFSKTETYGEALSKGYLNPTGSTSSPANRFTVSGRTDSLLADLSLHYFSTLAAAKTTIDAAMTNFQQYNAGGDYLNLWGFATGGVKCNTVTEGCLAHWNNNSYSFNADSLCEADLDQAWRIFRSQYLRIREDWIDSFARVQSGILVFPYDSCMAVFPNRNISTTMQNGVYAGYAGTAADTSKGRTNAELFYEDNCKAYVKMWWQQLAPCDYTSADSAIIIPRLIQVCKEGSDANHPFGSSTVKPGSTNAYNSFEQVIATYNDSAYHGINKLTCNAYLISRPQRYDQPGMIVNLPVISVPDSCTCSKINDLYFQFIPDSSIYHTFSNYLQQVHGSTISQGALDTLRNMCGGDTACRYLKNPILLPPALQCNGGSTCADCNTIRTLYDTFTHKYFLTPVLADDDSVQLINTLFANYMNQHLGFSKQAWEYLVFMSSCPPADSITCDSTLWIVFNPGTNFAINADLYANAVNNIPPFSQFFSGGYFNSPTTAQATHYVLVNKKDSIPASTTTLIMQWRVKPGSDSKMADPFIRRGAYVTYVGASWIRDPEDTTWWIGSTTLPGKDGNMLKGIGLTSNSHGLKADWVKVINPSNGQLLYSHNFTSAGSCTSQGPFLCGQLPADSAIQLKMSECTDSTLFATQNATQLFKLFRQKIKGNFERAYNRKCMDAGKLESFTVTHPLAEYHYTLYYYDQAGNLVKTVPPEGVWVARRTTWLDSVTAARAGNALLPAKHNDSLSTTYRYNSLNQVISQHSPDGGLSKFWYDRLGRLAISQNAKQKIDTNYSYTLYDTLGRITEVGQKKQTTQMTDAISRSTSSLKTWLGYTYAFEGGGTVIAEQVTKTFYDNRDDEVGALPPGLTVNTAFQKAYTLRNRVSSTRFYDKLPILGGNIGYGLYNSSSIYSYDIHGNVDTLLHDYQSGLMAQPSVNIDRFKVIAYQYDLISGKVNQVHYQPGMTDQLYHRYEYDAENRLTDVYITDRKELIGIPVLEEHDARYSYYKHGPLARTVLGQQMVQGIDYAYTLQGWLKGVNSDTLTDGDATASAIDAYRFSLNYFNGDYNAIGSSVKSIVFAGHSAHLPDGDYRPLFNGNISSMVVGIPKLGETRLYNYGYDQLNRLTKMDAWTGYNTATHSWGTLDNHDGAYKERIAYDGNGNILKYLRNGYQGKESMDSLSYKYNRDVAGNLKNNKLRHIRDAVSDGQYTEDIDSQADDNYSYDKIGNLIKDTKDSIDNITWTVYGKIKKIEKTNGTDIVYTYDPGGNRISKSVINGTDTTITWYVRDAQGNPMGVYSGHYGSLTLNEHHLYGSSRLGIWNRNLSMLVAADLNNGNFVRGNKFFELTNHLGNVLVTISDKKFGHDGGGGIIDYYNPDVVNANDYYPFGMLQPGRKFNAGELYRYGFNGKENDNDVKGEGNQQDYGMRIYDPRLGRFLSVDPIIANYPELTPYQFASNRPITAIDMDGLEAKDLERELEPVRAQRKREEKYGITYPETRGQRYVRYFVTGGLGFVALAPLTVVGLTTATLSAQAAATNVVIWLSNPANAGIVLWFAEAGLELINPDPGYNVDLGTSGGETMKEFKLLFRTKASKIVTATLEDGAKFENLSEVNWFEKLLAEGNNVTLLKESTKESEKSADFLVNGVKTEIKEISNIVTEKLGSNIKTTIEKAVIQAGEGGNIVIDVTKQRGATKELLQNTIERLQKTVKNTTNYRIVGENFELSGTIKKQ
jgi:RHS repeat-associated protein